MVAAAVQRRSSRGRLRVRRPASESGGIRGGPRHADGADVARRPPGGAGQPPATTEEALREELEALLRHTQQLAQEAEALAQAIRAAVAREPLRRVARATRARRAAWRWN